MNQPEHPQAQKSRKGLHRLFHATRYSVAGFNRAWHETAFRQELICSVLMLPAAFWVGQTTAEVLLLIVVTMLVMIVELLNTAIEVTINRIGHDYHDLSKQAKDLGSAAVLFSLLLSCGTWGTLLYARLAA